MLSMFKMGVPLHSAELLSPGARSLLDNVISHHLVAIINGHYQNTAPTIGFSALHVLKSSSVMEVL